jgi:transcriptional regulator with XRE-family HTH domain
MEHFYAVLGRLIRLARDAAGLTHAELGEQVSLSRASVANIERGNQRIALHQFVQIAQALGVEPALLLPTPQDRETRIEQAVRRAGLPEEIASWGVRAAMRAADEGETDDTEQSRTGG